MRGVRRTMNEYETSKIPAVDAYGSLGLALAAAAVCAYLYGTTTKIYYLLGGVGFVIISPIWFHAPIKFKKFFGPLKNRIVYRRKFSTTQGLLSLIGYAILVVAACLGLYEKLFA